MSSGQAFGHHVSVGCVTIIRTGVRFTPVERLQIVVNELIIMVSVKFINENAPVIAGAPQTSALRRCVMSVIHCIVLQIPLYDYKQPLRISAVR